MVKLELVKRDFVWIGLIVVLLGVGFVYGFGGSNPGVMGHSSGEIVVDDALCNQVTGHNCGYDDNTNAASICGNNRYLKGDGTCVLGDDVDSGTGGTTCECDGAVLPHATTTQKANVYECGITQTTSVGCIGCNCGTVYNYLCVASIWSQVSTTGCPMCGACP